MCNTPIIHAGCTELFCRMLFIREGSAEPFCIVLHLHEKSFANSVQYPFYSCRVHGTIL
jgi:hypothetical protein